MPETNHMNPTQQTGKSPSRIRFTGSVLCAALCASSVGAFAQSAAPASEEIVKLDPFTVSTTRDYGYRASNSIAGTRTDTPIKDVPLNIQVFTKELAEDLLIKTQVDFEAYNASLVYGAADRFSDNAIQQPYQNFLVRGFRQNWGLRDGIREYDPIDTQGLARVELVKGPAAALYGLAYPGGVMNNISKTVDFSRNLTQVRLSAGLEGDYRANIDANYSGELSGGKFGVRFNGTYEQSADVREHSKGKVRLDNVVLAWQPTSSTKAELLLEKGFRSKPNGLGWFSTGNEAGAAGNRSDIPLQILNPTIPWEWNWANGSNSDSLDTKLYRGKITQKIGDNFSIEAYGQYSTRLEITGNGWDANGSGGADSWESQGSGYDAANNRIISTYHYRDWGNKMHAYGTTAVYKLDFDQVKNTFAFGAAMWAEAELSRASGPYDSTLGGFGSAASLLTAIYYPIQANINTKVPNPFLPGNVVPEVAGGPNGNGYHHEDNSNDYYFINWQMSAMDNRLKTVVGFNKTNIKTVAWDHGASTTNNTYVADKVSPLYGVTFDLTKEFSVFLSHSTSLFPDSTKDSFGKQFSPQVGSSIEGGIKFATQDDKWSGTISYYNIKQTGGTEQTPNHENLNTATWDSLTPAERAVRFPNQTRADLFAVGDIIQGGEQESKGFDIDVVYQPTRNWQFVGSFANVNHEFTVSSVASNVGKTYPQAIKTRYSLLSKYTFTEGELKGLSAGFGMAGGSKALMDYQTWNGVDVARYEPGRITLEAFASYKFKTFGRNSMVQLNLKNLLKTPDYIGWKATGSSSVLATERYKIPTPLVVRLTYGIDL